MNYTESLDFIHGIARFGSKPGLRRVSLLLERMGNPQNKLRFVHIAGTNGKGSTSTMLSYVLKQAGCKTGLYISPFVLDFRERIQINNELIPCDELAASATLVKTHWDSLDRIGETPTEFEVVTAIAMDYFWRLRCDVVVLEVGLGGRFDATNVINTPLCSVITSIGLDHTEYLGGTIAEIAFEKCGIIKENGITVSSSGQPDDAFEVISRVCNENCNRLIVGASAEIMSMDIFGSRILYDGLELRVPLAGAHQIINAITVIETAKALNDAGLEISGSDVISGIESARFVSRLEILSKNPLALLDGAHNLPGAEALSASLKLLSGRKIHAVAGFMADKDIDGILSLILPHCESLTAVTPSNPRAMRADRLADLAAGYLTDISLAETMEEAVRIPLLKCGSDDVILIFGSLYLAADIRTIAKTLLSEQV